MCRNYIIPTSCWFSFFGVLGIMSSLGEEFKWYNDRDLPIIDGNFSDIVKLERECLVKIFECKDNIDSSIATMSIKEKKDGAQKELLENFVDSRRNLFKKFFVNYCQSKKLLKFSDNFSDNLKKYSEIEDIVRYNIWVKIFNEIKKDNILDFFDKPLEYDDVYEFIDEFISKFVDSIDDYIYEEMPDWIEKDSMNDFLWYLKNIILKLIKLKICDDHDKLDLDALFDLISETIYASIEKWPLYKIYSEFLNEWFDSENLVDGKYDDVAHDELDDLLDDDFDIVMSGVKQLVNASNIKGVDDLDDLDFSAIDWAKIADDAWIFLKKNPKFIKWFNPFDEDAFVDKICSIVLDDESYDVWKKTFIRRVRFPVNTWDLKLMNIKDSEDIMNFISHLREKYPKAKNHIWNIWSHNLKDKKIEFLSTYNEKLLNDVSEVLDDDFFKKLSLVQLFKIMHVYLLVLNSNNFDLSEEFEEFLKVFLERRFAESDGSVRGKEAEKMARKSEQQPKQPESVVKIKKLETEQVQKKEWLSKELLEDLDFYFTHVDNSFSDDEKTAIIRILEKLPWKFYKRSWFKEFELNDIFFQNLDKNWYVCEDDSSDEDLDKDLWKGEIFDVSGWLEILDGTEWNVDNDDILKINDLLSEINNLDDVALKIGKYFEVLKILWYSFFKKELRIKEHVINLCNSNPAFYSSFENTIVNVVNWSQNLEKKEKKWKNMPVYCLDIWWTWYRLVCLSVWNNDRKSIYAVMPHKEYITFLDKKCHG